MRQVSGSGVMVQLPCYGREVSWLGGWFGMGGGMTDLFHCVEEFRAEGDAGFEGCERVGGEGFGLEHSAAGDVHFEDAGVGQHLRGCG